MIVFLLILLISCLPLRSMNYIPENTILLSPEEALAKVECYHKKGLSVSDGLIEDLRNSENDQVKKILHHSKLNVDQAFNEIQSAKKAYDASEPTHTTTTWTKMLSKKMASTIAQKAEALGLDPSKLNIQKLNEHKYSDSHACANLNATLGCSINNNKLKVSIKERTFPVIEFATKISTTTIPHELLHIKEKHSLTTLVIQAMPSLISEKKDATFKRLRIHLSLAKENFAEQYASLINILENPLYAKRLFKKLKNNVDTAFIRPGGDHPSLFEECVAAENITQLLTIEKRILSEKVETLRALAKELKIKKENELAENKSLYQKSRINPKLSQNNNGLRDLFK